MLKKGGYSAEAVEEILKWYKQNTQKNQLMDK